MTSASKCLENFFGSIQIQLLWLQSLARWVVGMVKIIEYKIPPKLDGCVKRHLQKTTVILRVHVWAMARWKRTFTWKCGSSSRPPTLKPPNFGSLSWNVQGQTTSAKCQRVVRERGWPTFGKMCLPHVGTKIYWWVVWCACTQTLLRRNDSGSSRFHTCIEVKAKDMVSWKDSWIIIWIHLGFSISYFCWQCLVCLAVFWSCFGPPCNPEGVKAAWFLARKRLAKVLPTRKLWSSPFLFRRRMLDGKKHSKLSINVGRQRFGAYKTMIIVWLSMTSNWINEYKFKW